MLTDDAVLMPPNSPPVVGREAIRTWSEAASAQVRIEDYRPADEELIVAGDWAIRRATFTWTLRLDADPTVIQDAGKFIIVYRREDDGSWRVARDIWNSNTPLP